MKKKALAAMTAMVLAGMSLAGCGSSSTSGSAASTTAAADAAAATTEAEANTAAEPSTTAATDAAFAATEAGEVKDQSGKTYKVGIVQYMDHASLNQITEYIEKELDAKAAETGATYDYKDYFFNGEGDATTLNQIGAQLKDDGVDIVVAIATPTAQIMQSVFEGTDTPIIFSAVTDPEGAGLVASNDAPGANITGTSDALNTDAIMNLIFAQNPDADKIGLLYSKSEDSSKQPIEDAKAYLEGKVASGAIVATDGAKAYRKPLRSLDVRRHEASPSGAHAINRVNNLHSRIMEFIDGFHGVATRRLWNYLAWSKWLWTFRVGRTAETVADMVVKQAGADTNRTTWRECKKTPHPFYDYWAKQAGWDATARVALPLAALRA